MDAARRFQQRNARHSASRSGECLGKNARSGTALQPLSVKMARLKGLPSGSGKGLQNPPRGFNSRRRLHEEQGSWSSSARPWDSNRSSILEVRQRREEALQPAPVPAHTHRRRLVACEMACPGRHPQSAGKYGHRPEPARSAEDRRVHK